MPPRTSQYRTTESESPAQRPSAAPVTTLGGNALLQRQIGNRAAAQLIQRQPTRHQAGNLIQREDDDDDDKTRGGYDDDDSGALLAEQTKVEDEYRDFGLDLIEAYRLMDQFSAAIAAKKNTTAAKALAGSLVSLSIKIATKFGGLPDIPDFMPDVSLPGPGGGVSLPDSSAVTEKAATTAGGRIESATALSGPSSSGVRHATTTLGGRARAAVKASFGSKGAAARTVVGMVIPVSTLENILRSVNQLISSKDDWNRSKGVLAQSIEATINTMDQICHRIEDAGMQEIAVAAAKRKVIFRSSVRTLAEVVAKYESKRNKLQAVIAKWEVKHMEARPLLSGSDSSSDDEF